MAKNPRVPCKIVINPNEFDNAVWDMFCSELDADGYCTWVKCAISELTKIYDRMGDNEDERTYLILGDVINMLSSAQIIVNNRN